MSKLFFYLDNRGHASIELSKLKDGNPGISGTDFSTYFTIELLIQNLQNIEITLATPLPCKFNLDGLVKIHAMDVNQAAKEAESSGCNFFVINKNEIEEVYAHLTSSNLQTITVGHNFYYEMQADLIANCKQVIRNIFVGQQQYDRYFDHKIINKSIVIGNPVPDLYNDVTRDDYEKQIIYVGSLVPSKGFHILAKYWKSIVSEFPDYKLKVVGTGQLYDRNAKLGSWGIAEASYEDIFIHYLLDENGRLLDSVDFLGIVGLEKYKLYERATLGVVNPSALSETFCISAVELQNAGCPVVSKRKFGLLDTVIHRKTGYLYRKESELPKYISKLIKDKELNNRMSRNARIFVRDHLDNQKIIRAWQEMMRDVLHDKEVVVNSPKNFFMQDLKWLKIINRKLRNIGLLKSEKAITYIRNRY